MSEDKRVPGEWTKVDIEQYDKLLKELWAAQNRVMLIERYIDDFLRMRGYVRDPSIHLISIKRRKKVKNNKLQP